MMSFPWDISDQQVRLDADDMVQDVDMADLARLIEDFARSAVQAGDGGTHAEAVIVELRQRAAAGRIHRSVPESGALPAICQGPFGPLAIEAVALSPVEEDEIPW